MLNCDNCGTEIKKGERFCSQCGKPIIDNKPQKCTACDYEIKPGAKFCTHCGEPVKGGDTSAEGLKPEAVSSAAPEVKEEKLVEKPEPEQKLEPEPEPEKISDASVVAKPEIAVPPPSPKPEVEAKKDKSDVFNEIEANKEEWKKSLADNDAEASPEAPPAAEAPAVIEEIIPERVPDVTGDLTAEVDVKMPSKIKYVVFGIIAFLLIAVIILWVKIIPDSLGRGASEKSIDASNSDEPPVSVVPEKPEESSVVESSSEDEKVEFKFISDYRIIAQWDEVKSFDENGLAWVKRGELVGIVDKDGDYVIPLEYSSIGEFHEDVAVVGFDGKFGFIDIDGRIIVRPMYDSALAFSEGTSVVSENGRYGFVSTQGKEVLALEFDYATGFYEGFAAVKQGNDTFFIDSSGVKVSPEYDGAGRFSEGLAPVEMNDKWGYVNTAMELVIPYKYDSASSFLDGVAIVTEGDDQFFIDTEATEKSPRVEQIWPLSEGLATVRNSDLYGYVDGKSTQYVIEPQYTNAYAYSGGMCTVEDIQGNWYYMTRDNKPAIEKAFDGAYQFNEDFARVRVGANYTIIDKDGKQAVEQEWELVGTYANRMLPISEGGLWGFVEIVAP